MKPTVEQLEHLFRLVTDGIVTRENLQRFLEKPNLQESAQMGTPPPAEIDRPDFKVWRTIKVGTPDLKTADDFRAALKAAGCWIGDWASDLLGQPAFKASTEESELDLAVMSTKQLTGKAEASYAEICAAIIELGGQLCPPEAGPQLRLQYGDQPDGEWLIMAMEAITGSVDGLHVFNVGRDGGELWLSARYGNPDYRWNAADRWVFVIPRK